MNKPRALINLLCMLAMCLAWLGCSRAPAPGPAPAAPAEAPPPAEATLAGSVEELMLIAIGTDAARAQSARRQIEQAGQCPYLPDSPETPIGMLVAAYGNADHDRERIESLIQLLATLGCDMNQYNASGLTPVHNAVLFRQPELLRFLLAQGADPLLRTIAVPGKPTGQKTANLDALGFALALKSRQPDEKAYADMADFLKTRDAKPAQ